MKRLLLLSLPLLFVRATVAAAQPPTVSLSLNSNKTVSVQIQPGLVLRINGDINRVEVIADHHVPHCAPNLIAWSGHGPDPVYVGEPPPWTLRPDMSGESYTLPVCGLPWKVRISLINTHGHRNKDGSWTFTSGTIVATAFPGKVAKGFWPH